MEVPKIIIHSYIWLDLYEVVYLINAEEFKISNCAGKDVPEE